MNLNETEVNNYLRPFWWQGGKTEGWVRIPTQIGHPFRSNPAGHSEANRPPSD
jgi:hypothetical protein